MTELKRARSDQPLPAPGEWNDAVAHSLANPTHILGAYHDANGEMHMACEGDGDPYEPSNCDFTTDSKEQGS